MAVFKTKDKDTWTCKFRFTDWTGTVKQVKKTTFSTKKEAKDYEKQYLDRVSENSDITFKTLAEHYLEDKKKSIKVSSYNTMEKMVSAKLIPSFGNLRVCDITPLKVRKWQNEMKEAGYKNTYLKNMNNQLSTIMKYGCNFYQLRDNPCKRAGSMGSSKGTNVNFWTKEEFDSFLNVVNDTMYKTLFNLLFYSGMRIGEALAITYEDFDFTNQTVRINKNHTKIHGVDYILTPKTIKGNRTITLPKFILNQIKNYYSVLFGVKKTDRLFPITKSAVEHRLENWIKKTSVKKIRLHDLRHSHASMLINQGFQVLLISERLGHENIQTTLQIYSHLYPNKQNDVSTFLENLNHHLA